MYENLIPIVSLIVSIFAVIFTAVSVGFSFTLGFREREETSRRRTEIKTKLQEEVKKNVSEFFERNREKKKVDEKMMDEIWDLGLNVDYTSLGDALLENVTYYGNQFLRQSAFTLIYSLLSIVSSAMYWDVLDIFILVLISPLLFVVIVFLILAYSSLRKYYYFRENFLKLHEDPRIETCVLIEDDLESKKVKRIY